MPRHTAIHRSEHHWNGAQAWGQANAHADYIQDALQVAQHTWNTATRVGRFLGPRAVAAGYALRTQRTTGPSFIPR